ncbi:MAG: HlyD family efflux transporter periplasmic adaptor subunit [Planctomycetota bacterium]
MDLSRLQIDRGNGPRRAVRRGTRYGRWVMLAALLGAGWIFRAPLLAQLARARATEVEVANVVRAVPGAVPATSGTAANGYIVARRRAALSADTPGRIIELNVTEGSVLRAGDVVARLYSDEVAAALRGAEAQVASGEAAVHTAEARIAAAQQRSAEARARVEAAEATRDESSSALALAESELKRALSLVASGGVTAERVDQARATVEQARARLAATDANIASARVGVASAEADVAVARADLAEAEARLPVLAASRDLARATVEKTFVRAPFDGVVVLKDAEVGEVVSPNALGGQSRGSVATMVDFASLEVQVELPEMSLASVREDQPVEVFLDAFATERFAGRVLRIWPTANRQKGTIELRIGLDQIDPRMRPEMGARVVFTPEQSREPKGDAAGSPGDGSDAAADMTPRLMVPATALVERNGVRGVFVVDGDVARFRAVTAGAPNGRRVALEEGPAGAGLDEGERVIASPPAGLADGDRVRVPHP